MSGILSELAEAPAGPFILEDLHWTDPSTLELLELLVAPNTNGFPLTSLTCRPAFSTALDYRSYLTEITVNRLSREQITRMAVHT